MTQKGLLKIVESGQLDISSHKFKKRGDLFMMSQLPKVGQNLRRLRNSLGLSLDEASKL